MLYEKEKYKNQKIIVPLVQPSFKSVCKNNYVWVTHDEFENKLNCDNLLVSTWLELANEGWT